MAVTTIKEINDQYSYEDKKAGGSKDSSLVSCGQCTGYNELQYIYDEKLKPFIDQSKFTKQDAITALEKTCKELANPRDRDDFYKKLSTKLSVTIKK